MAQFNPLKLVLTCSNYVSILSIHIYTIYAIYAIYAILSILSIPSIHPSVRRSVRPSVRPSVHPSMHSQACLAQLWWFGMQNAPHKNRTCKGLRIRTDVFKKAVQIGPQTTKQVGYKNMPVSDSDIHRDGIFQCIKEGKISVFMISLPGFPEKNPRISQCSAIETCPCPQHLPHAKVASNYPKCEKQFACEESLLGSDDPFLFGQKSERPGKISSGHHTSRPFFFGRYPTVGTSKS